MTETFEHGYALLIGVGECKCQPLSLPVTVKDTQAIYAALIDAELCAYPDNSEHIRVLNNEEATRGGILDGLQWLKEKAEADSEATIFIYYSGHGGFEKGDGYYLMPHDYDPWEDNPLTTALSAEQLTEALREISAQRLLVVIDSCHAAGMATSKDGDSIKAEAKLKKALKGLKRVAPSKGLIETLKQGKGRAVFTSSEGKQKSWIKDSSMSIYTFHFLEALQGAGNKAGDTEVKVSNLMRHLGDTVSQTAQNLYKVEQTPHFDLDAGDFVIAKLRGGKGLSDKGRDEVKSEATDRINVVDKHQEINQRGKINLNTGHNSTIHYYDGVQVEPKTKTTSGQSKKQFDSKKSSPIIQNVEQDGETNLNFEKASNLRIGDD